MQQWLSITVAFPQILPRHARQPSTQSSPVVSKTPRVSLTIHERKEPISVQIDWLAFKPSWRIIALEMADPYGWHMIDAPTLSYIRGKLLYFETMTLDQIFVKARKQNHGVELYKLCPRAQVRLRQLGYDDLDELYTLRLSGLERIWGIRECNVFSILWWDPNHEVCPSLR